MTADRYLKVILTIIALELLWIGVRDVAPVSANQSAQPMAVVVTGQPLQVRVSDPVQIAQPVTVQSGIQPLTIQTGVKPLSIEPVPFKPGIKPGY